MLPEGNTEGNRMSETANQIIDVMANLIQSRGYNAVSYQDISDTVGIRKASIHYHFPSKTDLGVAVIKKYSRSLMEQLNEVGDDPAASAIDKLNAYFDAYLGFRGDDRRVCLCGGLAGEYYALPELMQTEVSQFFDEHQAWLTALFAESEKSGALNLIASPAQTAKLYFDALQGALLAKRAAKDDSQIDDVVATLRALVK